MDKDIEISIDPKLAEFAAKCGPEAFKAYLDFVDKKTTEKVNLMAQRIELEKKMVERDIKAKEYELSEKDSFYNVLENMCSGGKSFDNKTDQIQN